MGICLGLDKIKKIENVTNKNRYTGIQLNVCISL